MCFSIIQLDQAVRNGSAHLDFRKFIILTPTTTMKPAMRVLISGAGVAGPTLAWFLAKAGARITVVEKAPALLPYGQNVDMRGSAVSVIRKMGLLDEVRRANTTEKGTQFIDSRGRPFAPFPVQQGSSASFTSEYEILRGDLAALLHAATKDFPNVDYRFGTTVRRVVSNGDDAVTVELSNGEVCKFDLLVAADGQWSKLRAQCFPAGSIDVVDKNMYAAYFTLPRRPGDDDWWNVYPALGARLVSIRPDPHGTVRAGFTRMPCTPAQAAAWDAAAHGDRHAQKALLRKEFADAGWQAPRLLDAMGAAPDFYFHAIQQIKMAHWSTARVVCLGDAAHAPSPLTGMGTSLAITGAYLLAGELSKLDAGEHPARALKAYESAFRPFFEAEQKIPFFVPAIVHPATAWQRWLLQTFVVALSRLLAISWITNRLGDHTNAEDFRLPHYPRSDEEGTE